MSRGEVYGILGASAVAIGMGVIGYRLAFGEREKRAAEAKVASTTTKATPSAEREFGMVAPIGSDETDVGKRVTPEAVESVALAAMHDLVRPYNLTGADIQKVVKAITPRVKQECWQPALDSRPPGDPATARVSFELEIDTEGKVAKIRGVQLMPGYPGLKNCIEEIVRESKFPKAENSTSVNIPFVFAAE